MHMLIYIHKYLTRNLILQCFFQGTICIINNVKILLWDRDNRSYSYYVEVSVNQKHWDRVIDYRDYYCRSWQFLYFPARPVRYVRLVGTFNTINKVSFSSRYFV